MVHLMRWIGLRYVHSCAFYTAQIAKQLQVQKHHLQEDASQALSLNNNVISDLLIASIF